MRTHTFKSFKECIEQFPRPITNPYKLNEYTVEQFIKDQEVRIAGRVITDGYYLEGLNCDFSRYPSSKISIEVADATAHRYNVSNESEQTLYLSQAFFDDVFKQNANEDKPKLKKLSKEDFYETDSSVSIYCVLYPIILLEKSILYKLDISVELPATIGIKEGNCSGASDVIINFFQRHFTVDREGLYFKDQAEKALKECFLKMYDIFLETKDKTILMLDEQDEK